MAVSQASSSSSTDSMRMRLVALLIAFHNLLVSAFPSRRDEVDPAAAATMGIMDAVKMVGGAVVGIAVIVLVVNEVLTVEAINNTSGPFSPVVDSLGTTGVAAMTLLVVGLLVVAATYIMNYMDNF